MLVLVDDMLLYILLGLAATFFAGFGALFILITRSPQAVRAIISAWILKRVLTIEATLDKGFRFVARKRGPEGTLEAKVDGRLSTKMIPNNPEPSLSMPYHLEGSGVKVFLGLDASTLAFTPGIAAAVTVASYGDPAELPLAVKEWAEHRHIDGKQLLEIQRRYEEKDGKKILAAEKFIPFNFERLVAIAKGWWTEAQWRNQIRKKELEAREGLHLNSKMLVIGLVIVVVFVIIAYAAQSGMLK